MEQERQAVLDVWTELRKSKNLEELRENYDRWGEAFGVPAGVSVATVQIGHCAAEWLEAKEASRNVVLYFHGGGYSTGSLRSHRHLGGHIAKQFGGRVLLLEYRLSPDHIFPAALDDALAAYAYLRDDIKIPAGRICLMGDSAGGNLVILTLLALRDRGLPLPSSGVCISPWTDYHGESPSGFSKADVDPVMVRERSMAVAKDYFAGTDMRQPPATILDADLKGLPPLLIQVGSEEVLLDDSTRLATRAAHDDVAVTLEVWPRMAHVFPHFYPILELGRQAIDQAATFMTRHFISDDATSSRN